MFSFPKVVFTNTPPAMTWQYPQARTLTRVSVFPVPFQSAAINPLNYDFDREVFQHTQDKFLKMLIFSKDMFVITDVRLFYL